MYGMVNNALKDLICAEPDATLWKRVMHRAELDDDLFLTTESYPDGSTYRLVDAAAVEMNITTDEVLHRFGRWWVLKVGRNCYEHILECGGRTLRDFLFNLPNFHTRVMMIFPDLKPPEFECLEIADGVLELHYRSHRPGLAPFVIGLLDGLSEMFETPIAIRHHQRAGHNANHDVFHIIWDS